MDNQTLDASDAKTALLERVKSSKNILVTVNSNPTVDQLAACLGLTIWLNKAEKHATAVFSGNVPSTLEFLQPDETLEKNTDSLRDFIISLDKSKADKLRYKVEDDVVKIFITPYRTSLSGQDLDFSQGDFNVDMVIALGVTDQADLDAAITAHGRILHDATVATITQEGSELGSINWQDSRASSLSELVVGLGNDVDRSQLDGQIATALLTGIVAETDRFSNDKTTPQTMSISAQLMTAGANQQLVASELEAPKFQPEATPDEVAPEAPKPDDGTLEIEHEANEEEGVDSEEVADSSTNAPPESAAEPEFEPLPSEPQPPAGPQISDVKSSPNESGEAAPTAELPAPVEPPAAAHSEAQDSHSSKFVTEPPSMGGTLTANSRPDDVTREPASDPMTLGALPLDDKTLLDRQPPAGPPASPTADWLPPQPWMDTAKTDAQPSAEPQPSPTAHEATLDELDEAAAAASQGGTLTDIEKSVDSPHLAAQPDAEEARSAVDAAVASMPDTNLPPVEALNAQPVDLDTAAPPEPAMPTPPANPVPSTPYPTGNSTAFNPTEFDVMNDTDNAAAKSPAAAPAATAADRVDEPAPADTPVDQPFTMPLPPALTPPPANPVPPTSATAAASAPPPVPPPLMPPGFPPAR